MNRERRWRSSTSTSRSRARRLRSSAIWVRRCTSSARSVASTSAWWRISGNTAPSIMAERTDCSASSARIMSAGGVCRPIRCSAASTSAISPRRALLDVDDAGGGLDDLLIEFSPVVPDRLDLALELGFVLENPALLGAELFELLVALLEHVETCGRAGRAIGVGGSRRAVPRGLGRRGHQPERQKSQRCQDDRAEQEGGRRYGLHRPVLCKNGSNGE